MPILLTLDVMLAKRKMRARALAAKIGMREQHLSDLKCGKVKGVRFETLERLCQALDCQPGDLLEFRAVRHVAPAQRLHDGGDVDRQPVPMSAAPRYGD